MVFKSPLAFLWNFCDAVCPVRSNTSTFSKIFVLIPESEFCGTSGDVVPLTPKAADVLLALIKQHGDVLERSELLDAVWKDTFVERRKP